MDKCKIATYFNTIKYLKFKQILYLLKNKIGIYSSIKSYYYDYSKIKIQKLKPFPLKRNILIQTNKFLIFNFLNVQKKFLKKKVEFNYKKNGLLWTYNLNYFDFLVQKNISYNLGVSLLFDFYNKNDKMKKHSYPISIRIINVIKFFSFHNKTNKVLLKKIFQELIHLVNNIEHHLRGNHVLENAISIYAGGVFFKNKKIKKIGFNLLKKELKEQILDDGMHFERSPMYHLILFERILDLFNIIKSYEKRDCDILVKYSKKMMSLALNWNKLKRVPMMQDSTYFNSNRLNEIFNYYKKIIGIKVDKSKFSKSGYRVLKNDKYQIFLNIGNISPDYQPGHSHADELNFEIYKNNYPIIVDTGISTYEKTERRLFERSTVSHNCLSINNENSSEVWSSFRVGQRAKVIIEDDKFNLVSGFHDGFYKKYNTFIYRKWKVDKNKIIITDSLDTSFKKIKYCFGRIHFNPEVNLRKLSSNLFLANNDIFIEFKSTNNKFEFLIEDYFHSKNFNNLLRGKLIKYPVFNKMIILIYDKKK
tara:strand:+ start:23526 stop:25124 length:1599 start_codon:yes stop_codon:yes gene_type:complete